QLGYEIQYETAIDSPERLRELEEAYDAIFLGVGLGSTRSLQLQGEDKGNVIGAVEFIEELRMQHHRVKVPDRVIVLGGGNTAMDAASETARMGARTVTLAYRRSKEEMGGYAFEYELAKSVGATGLFNVSPLEILGDEKASGVRFIRTESRNGQLATVADSEFEMECDLVIKATGQAKQGNFLRHIDGLELDDRSRIVVDSKTYQTKNEKYFAGGDAVNGGAEVVNAAYEGKMAAQGIHEWLENELLPN
ncbi:MAG: FAD-dependent oxidoreductase, partial [Saprospiraceae bacterium]|nr:FAD-dependent oxidoreductase [Saprospiraceae bacterium]